ncbi:MAG: excinuclease ABC subunit UvrC [Clostridia bacterium]|nr:excinuclease ABC subunit UvrC [Clostridia bacterium]
MFDIEQELKKLPDKPGVYIMHDKNDKIIYVGKAISLKNRVRQYFRKTNKTKRIENMVSLIDYFEYIVTDNESEALILECNLIKKNMPKFNVLLKDDKTYPYIKVNVQETYPDVYITRRVLNDGAKYFGPYANAGAAKEMVEFIKSKFQIRQCKSFKFKDRPCLNYHIKKCSAPCMNYISKEEYQEQISQIINLLSGKTALVVKQLEQEMKEASEKLDFEKAAYLRDKKLAIEKISYEKQKVSNLSENDIDVIGLARNELRVCIEVFFVRNSKMVGREHYFFEGLEDETDKEILSDFMKQYYMNNLVIPHKIMLKEEIEDKELLEKSLAEKVGRNVEIKSPQKGEKLRLVEMAERNAKITLENTQKEKYSVVNELKKVLKMEKMPRKIESYDISNLSGEYVVAAMCVLYDGQVKKNLSRTFKIKTVLGQDDPKCMQEVVTRRLKHSLENPKGGFGELPDAIFVDGGITQMRAVKEAVQVYNLTIPLYGMVKDDKHTTRALIDENRNELKLSERLMNTITYFQDCVHEKAIGYHRKLRGKDITKSELDNILGIGPAKKKQLLKHFGSISKIKQASIEELTKVTGINEELAKKIKQMS